MQKAFDVAIIGGGVAGLAAALELVAAGKRRVAVFDAGQAGEGSSLAGGGGVRSQFLHPLNVALTLRTQAILAGWMDRFGIDPDYQRNGYLYLATRPEHLPPREAIAAVATSAGARVDRLDASDVARLIPGLRTDGILAAWHSPDDGVLSPAVVFGTLRSACLRAGVEIVESAAVGVATAGGRVEGVEGAGGRHAAGEVVVAAGVATRALVERCGMTLPIRPQRGQIFTMPVPQGLPRRMPLVFDMGTRGYLVTTRQGMVIGGSDREEGDDFDPADAARIVGLLEHRVPGISVDAVTGGHAGVRAASPDDLGILGPVPGVAGLHVLGGFGHHGFMHAMPAAELLVDRMCGRTSAIDPAPMDPARFLAGAAAGRAGA